MTGATKTSDSVAAIGYVRVSTSEQAESGAGLAAQRTAIEQTCHHREWHLLEVAEDAGLSGKNLKRPGLIAAIERLEAGDASVLVVAKLDRLSRSLMDFAALMERSRQQGWALVALDLGVDTSTPHGEMIASVMASFAQYERRLIGLRTKDALAVKKAEGVRLGRPPVVEISVRRRIAELRDGGLTYRAIAAQLEYEGVAAPRGGTRWYDNSVRRLCSGS